MSNNIEAPILHRFEKGTLYYYKGNFYYPINLGRAEDHQRKKAIKKWLKKKQWLLNRDRADVSYRPAYTYIEEE